jgi:hypothetical protein
MEVLIDVLVAVWFTIGFVYGRETINRKDGIGWGYMWRIIATCFIWPIIMLMDWWVEHT